MEPMLVVSAAAVLFLGSLVQRVAGTGLALVASPLLVLILGATVGIQVLLIIGLAVCVVSAVMLRGYIDYQRAAILLAASVVGLVPGAVIARMVPAAWLLIIVGGITLGALLSTKLLQRTKVFGGRAGTGLAGALTGFMTSTAALGGPPMVLYAQAVRWGHLEFVATVQLVFAGINVLSLMARGVPDLPWIAWITLTCTALGGMTVGHLTSQYINQRIARIGVLVIAILGSIAAVLKGVFEL
ncbi:sulfite exporter TauE/SafE family protein [Rothia halotolerans]|uniref:sulfite exporter TauE/SafE family protein n=1 Tax=Rothia halotolerans TaxID=405770 RepID=UPI00101BABF6|nr:sulfite exporter TauE/SafE family protein [Rothia halotolerans]